MLNHKSLVKGFTLVELILYTALVGILLTAGAIFASDVALGSVKARVKAKVQSEARFALERMRQEIVKAKSLEAIQNSILVVSMINKTIQKLNAITGDLDTNFGNSGTVSTGNLAGHGIAYDPIQNAIWVTGGDSGVKKTRKYNAATGAPIGSDISGGATRLVHDPKQNAVWSFGSDSLVIINAANGAADPPNTASANYRAAAYDSNDNAVWITDFDLDLIKKYNAANKSLISSFSTNNGPKGIAYDARQNAIWVANENAETVQKFNASNGSLITTINNMPDAYVLAYDFKQNAIWVTSNFYNLLKKFDAATGAFLGVYSTNNSSHGIAYDPTQNAIWTGGLNLQRFDAATGSNPLTVANVSVTSVAYAFNCRFLFGDDATRVSFSINGDGKSTSLNTLQMCLKNNSGCGAADSWKDLTSSDIEVTNFSCQNISSGTSLGEEAVKINMTLKNKNPGGKKEFDATVTVETSIALRL